MSIVDRLLPRALRLKRQERMLHRDWRKRDFAVPLPTDAKRAVLTRYGYHGETWVETGTYLGETTAFLAATAKRVISLEPADGLFENAVARLRSRSNVQIIHGASEQVFPTLIPTLSGVVSFWLDGHYSGGNTFLGERDTPLKSELMVIAANLSRFSHVAVLIDDIRLCSPAARDEYKDYPTLDFLVDWCRQHELKWLIEHDIFVARSGF